MKMSPLTGFFLLMGAMGFVPSVARATPSEMFAEVGGHLVAAYEQLGALDTRYDEEGFCGPDCSIWLMTTDNPSVACHLVSFEPICEPGACGLEVGRYTGFVDFQPDAASPVVVRLQLAFVYSGEDITVEVTVVPPELPGAPAGR